MTSYNKQSTLIDYFYTVICQKGKQKKTELLYQMTVCHGACCDRGSYFLFVEETLSKRRWKNKKCKSLYTFFCVNSKVKTEFYLYLARAPVHGCFLLVWHLVTNLHAHTDVHSQPAAAVTTAKHWQQAGGSDFFLHIACRTAPCCCKTVGQIGNTYIMDFVYHKSKWKYI